VTTACIVGHATYTWVYAGDDPVNDPDPTGMCSWFNVWCEGESAVNAGHDLLFGHDVKLYEEYSSDIHTSAADFGLDPVLVATVIQLEGGGLETWAQALGPLGRAAQWGLDLYVKRYPGIGNTRPSNVQQVYETFCPGTPVPSLSAIRHDLTFSNPYGIWAAAGYLALLRYQFAQQGYGYLSDRDDSISYEDGGTSQWWYLIIGQELPPPQEGGPTIVGLKK
jgi:hypothetical protein